MASTGYGGIDGIDGDDTKCGMDSYVEDNLDMTTMEREESVRVNDHESGVNNDGVDKMGMMG